jgi:diguanylate cyclase (GGDEF)-like protein/PAS domain S-box-containing protein
MEWCEHYKTLTENLNQGVYFLDKDKKIIYWNQTAERITGYKAEEITGKSCSDGFLMHINEEGKNLCNDCNLCPVAIVINSGEVYDGELYIKHKDGHRILVHTKVFPVRNDGKEIIGAIEIFYDDSERNELKLRIQELEKMALLDSLTKIANRRFIEMQLSSRINEFKRFGWQFGVMFIDIDFFKLVNDRYGHEVGDRVLKMVANTLVENSRSFDLVGRWGGEEFIVIVPNVNETQLYTIAHKFKNLIALSNLKINSDIISVTVSIGVTLSRQKDTLKSIIKRADKLMYQSKLKGRNKVTTDFEIT